MNTARASREPLRDRGEIWKRVVYSVRNNVVAEMIAQTIRLGGFVILARQLPPADFGLLRTLIVASFFYAVLAEAGIPEALVQRDDLAPEHEATGWWLTLALAAATAGATYAGAPVIGRAMAMPRLTPALRLLSLPLLLSGSAAVAGAILRRQLRFGVLAVADVIGEGGFLSVALVLLYLGAPGWSLAGGLAARLSARALAILVSARRFPRSAPQIAAARDLSRFALSVLGGRAVRELSANADYILVGRLLGSEALGFYSLAWELLRFVPSRLSRVAGQVLVSAFCRLQQQNEHLARAYRDFVAYSSHVLLPVTACMVIAAPELVSGIYGPRWSGAAVPLGVLSIGLSTLGLRGSVGAVYYAKDHPSFDIYLHGSRLILVVLAVSLLARTGLFGVCAGVSAAEGLVGVEAQWLASRLLGISFWSLWRACIPGVRVAFWCAGATALGKVLVIMIALTGARALPAIMVPPALVFFWLEMAAARVIVSKAVPPFGTRLSAEPSQWPLE